jgi:hypothetical protein
MRYPGPTSDSVDGIYPTKLHENLNLSSCRNGEGKRMKKHVNYVTVVVSIGPTNLFDLYVFMFISIYVKP